MNIQCVVLKYGKFSNWKGTCMIVHQFSWSDVTFHWCQESGSRVVFGKNKHNNPPPVREI